MIVYTKCFAMNVSILLLKILLCSIFYFECLVLITCKIHFVLLRTPDEFCRSIFVVTLS